MLDLLNRNDFIIFTTRDYAGHEGLSMSAASKKLARLAKKKSLEKITKGVWANTAHPWFHPLACVPYLLGKEQGYVSFLTAMHLHGLLSQIPATIQIATTGHPRKLKSTQGVFEFIQIKPELMQRGMGWSSTNLPYLLANREKALIDTLYIATRKNRRFATLPELELDAGNFSSMAFWRLLNELPFPGRIRNAMEKKAKRIGVISNH